MQDGHQDPYKPLSRFLGTIQARSYTTGELKWTPKGCWLWHHI